VVLRSEVQLTSTPTPPERLGLYEWAAGGLQLLSVLPESEGGAWTSGALGGRGESETARHAVSNDGSRVFWHGGGGDDLYMRDVARGETLRLGAAARTGPDSKIPHGGAGARRTDVPGK